MREATEYTDRVLMVLRIVCRHGRENPVKGEQLQEMTGIDTRQVAEMAGKLASAGFMVCSGARGYFMARNKNEWDEHLEKERGRALAVLERIGESKRNAVDEPGLWEEGNQKSEVGGRRSEVTHV